MEPQTESNGEVWEQQRLLKDLQAEVKRHGLALEWTQDTLKDVRERVQGVEKSQGGIRWRLMLVIGGVVGFAAVFSYFMGNVFPLVK